jgi:hypothetical protein
VTRYRAFGRVDDQYYLATYIWRGRSQRIITARTVGDHGSGRYQKILSGRTYSPFRKG